MSSWEESSTNPVSSPGYVEPRSTDSLHELLQDHITRCDHCKSAIEGGVARRFGQAGRMCAEYYNLASLHSRGEFHRDDNADRSAY